MKGEEANKTAAVQRKQSAERRPVSGTLLLLQPDALGGRAAHTCPREFEDDWD
jgi:hypothetical protein